MKVVVILSGNGVYDGSETHEAVLTLLALDQAGINYQCAAPDIDQHHVINHLNGEEINQKRNVIIESARIARGNIIDLEQITVSDFDALVMPGGFGAAKNLSKWAFDGPQAAILPQMQKLIIDFITNKKPILAMCIAPTLIALALKNENKNAKITIGNTDEKTPYDIKGINNALQSIGAEAIMTSVTDLLYDERNKIITTPCYMQDVAIKDVFQGITKAVQKLQNLIS